MKYSSTSFDVDTLALTREGHLHSSLREIVAEASRVINFQDCSIALYDPVQQELVTLAGSNPELHTRHTRFKIGQGIGGHVAESLESALVVDVSIDPRFVQLGPRPVGSMLCVPIFQEGRRLLGTITAVSRQKDAFGEHQLRLLEMIASMAGRSLAQLVRAQQLQVLYEMGQQLLASTDTDQVFDLLRRSVGGLMSCDLLHLRQIAPIPSKPYTWWAASPVPDPPWPDLSALMAGGARVLLAEDLPPGSIPPVGVECHSFLFMPLLVANTALGYVLVGSGARRAYSSEHVATLETIGGQVALWLRNAALNRRVIDQSERLEALFLYSSEAIVMLTDGRVTRVNPAGFRLLGVEPDRVLGEQQDAVLCLSPVEAALGERPLYQLRTPRGSREVEMSISDVVAAGEEHRILTLRDVTEQRELERAKAHFMSMVSHELRTPLGSVLGFADVLYMSAGDRMSDEEIEYLEHIRTSSRRLVQLVNDILDLSRMDAGRFHLSVGPMLPGDIARQVLAELSEMARSAEVLLEADVPPNGSAIHGDARRVHQVLINIVGNALKVTPVGGTITVRVEYLGQDVRFSVEDTGPGIPEHEHERIFERFYQPVTSRGLAATTGSGLGLTIARQLVEAHQGRMWLESEVGRGSVFFFTLPASRKRRRPRRELPT
ncbi:MAG: GAF domain-containing protein [Chloroflexia bacterium]|nr:GAF domain-containing protein [Chloroflexia bacterium]